MTEKTTEPGITLANVKTMNNAEMAADGTLKCHPDTFRRDVAPGKPKQCLCLKNEGVKLEKTKWCARENDTCHCAGRVLFASFDSFLNKDSIQSYAAKDAWGGSIVCSTSEFGRDPAPGQTKYCFCATSVLKTPTPPLRTDKNRIVDKNGMHVTLGCANWSGA